jgi:hypothetical protein
MDLCLEINLESETNCTTRLYIPECKPALTFEQPEINLHRVRTEQITAEINLHRVRTAQITAEINLHRVRTAHIAAEINLRGDITL